MTNRLASLRAPRQRLGRELAIAVALKLIIIGVAATFIFGPHQRPRIDAAKVEAHLVGGASEPSPALPLKKEVTP